MNKQAQIIGQIFIFILAVILLGLILLYGYNAIKEFSKTKEDVTIIQLRDNLISAIRHVRSDYGSVKRYEFSLPIRYKKICFVEPIEDKNILKAVSEELYSISPLIADALEGGTQQNIFLVPFAQSEIIAPPLEIKDNNNERFFLCIENKGQIVLRLEGLGDKTRVGEWE